MKLKSVFFIYIFCMCNRLVAQTNQVQNPSFETYWQCPNFFAELRYANYWSPIDTLPYIIGSDTFSAYGCSPCYCNTCSTDINTSVPVNSHFTHLPRTGNGMVELTMYCNYEDTTSFTRTYLQSRLKNTLNAGQQYCVTFYVTLEQLSAYAINNVGAYFDDGTIDTTQNCGLPQNTHIPQILDTTIINDTLNWVPIQGSFIATGTEKYITIGNFSDNAHTDTERVFFPFAAGTPLTYGWYLIDDVSVIATNAIAYAGNDTFATRTDSAWIGTHDGYLPCKWYTITGTLIDSNIAGFMVKPDTVTKYVMELNVCGTLSYDTVTVKIDTPSLVAGVLSKVNAVRLYPNPVVSALTIENGKGCSVGVYDVVGVEVLHTGISSDKESLDISGLKSGVYFVHVVDDKTGYLVVREVLKE